VVAEVALSLMLLIGAGLLIRSFAGLLNVPPGFDPDHVLSLQVMRPSTDGRPAGQTLPFLRATRRGDSRRARRHGIWRRERVAVYVGDRVGRDDRRGIHPAAG
jgi:hypothetical protein